MTNDLDRAKTNLEVHQLYTNVFGQFDEGWGYHHRIEFTPNGTALLASMAVWCSVNGQRQHRRVFGLGSTPLEATEDGLFQIAKTRPFRTKDLAVESSAAVSAQANPEPTADADPVQTAPEPLMASAPEPAPAPQAAPVQTVPEPSATAAPVQPVPEPAPASPEPASPVEPVQEAAAPKPSPAQSARPPVTSPTFKTAKKQLLELTDVMRLKEARVKIIHWFEGAQLDELKDIIDAKLKELSPQPS